MTDTTTTAPVAQPDSDPQGDRWHRQDAIAAYQNWTRYAVFGIVVFFLLFLVFGASAFTVMLLVGGALVAIGDRKTWPVPESVARHKRNPFGYEINLGYIGFGLLIIPLAWGIVNVALCLVDNPNQDPLYGIITVIMFMVLISYRFVSTKKVLVVGVAIAVAVYAITKLATNHWATDLIADLVELLPDLLLLAVVLLLVAVIVGWVKEFLKLNRPAKEFLIILVLVLGLELFAYTVNFSLSGAAGDLNCVVEQTNDPFPSNRQVTGNLGSTGLCDPDGADWAIALIRLLGLVAISVAMYGPQRRSVVKREYHPDDVTLFQFLMKIGRSKPVLWQHGPPRLLQAAKIETAAEYPKLAKRLDRDGIAADFDEWRHDHVLRVMRHEQEHGQKVTSHKGQRLGKSRIEKLFGKFQGPHLIARYGFDRTNLQPDNPHIPDKPAPS